MKKLSCLLLALLLSITLVACNQKPVEPSKPDDAPVDYYIAASLPFTGDNATYAEYIKRGMEIALMHLKEDGGINGKGGMIYVDYFDDRNDAKEGTNIAEQIISNDKYLLEIGSFSSSVSLPCAQIYHEAKFPQYALTCSHADFLGQTDWGFSLSMTQDIAAARVATWDVKYLGKKNIALLYSEDEWGNQCMTYYKAQVERLGGTLCAVESFEKNTADYTAVLTKLKQLQPDLVMCFCAENDIVLIMKQAITVGLDTEFQVSSKSRTSNVVNELGELAEGLYGVYATDKDMNNPVYKRYYDTYMELYPDEKSTQKYADQGYNCMETVIWAIENGGTTRQAFRDTLATLNNFPGIQGPITFTTGRRVLQEQFLSVVKNGEWVNIPTEEIGFNVDDYLVLS